MYKNDFAFNMDLKYLGVKPNKRHTATMLRVLRTCSPARFVGIIAGAQGIFEILRRN